MSTESVELERLTEAIDRLLVRLRALKSERDRLKSRIEEFESDCEGSFQEKTQDAYNLLRIHSARLLRERHELKQRLNGVLEKLDKL